MGISFLIRLSFWAKLGGKHGDFLSYCVFLNFIFQNANFALELVWSTKIERDSRNKNYSRWPLIDEICLHNPSVGKLVKGTDKNLAKS